MGRLPLAGEALLSKYSFVSAGAFVGFGRFAGFFPHPVPKRKAIIWLGLLHILGTKTVLCSWQGIDPESGRQCGTWMVKDEA